MLKGSILPAVSRIAAFGVACALADSTVKMVRYQDLSPAVREMLARDHVNALDFDRYVLGIQTSTAEREREGENDHLIYYILQSQEFTNMARIEPALSAKDFVEHGRIPADADARIRKFTQTSPSTVRLRYFHTLLPHESALGYLKQEYARAMRSLYDKEFLTKSKYYESRGHSTDTDITANYTLWIALSVLRASQPELKLERVLIVGPGLNIAPRTDLVDKFPPQSYQPYAVSQMLRELGFAAAPQIDCVDINERVIEFIRDFSRRGERRLEFRIPPGDPEYEIWGHSLASKLRNVPRNVADAVTAQKLNIITQRLDATYDLVIATNVLLYFKDTELLLAVANIESMLRAGGYFIHNEVRAVLDRVTAAAGLNAIQARTVKIGEGTKAPLYDAFAIYRK
jgi:hypothetical protein